jgi:hypothetical protein
LPHSRFRLNISIRLHDSALTGIVGLDVLVEGRSGGTLANETLPHLAPSSGAAKRPVLVAMHHPLLPQLLRQHHGRACRPETLENKGMAALSASFPISLDFRRTQKREPGSVSAPCRIRRGHPRKSNSYRRSPKDRLALAKEEGEGTGRRDEEMQHARPSRACLADRASCRFGQLAGIAAASNRLRADHCAGL